MLEAYRLGAFPMGDTAEGGPIRWYSPDPRGIIPLEGFHVPRRLADKVRSRVFEVTTDRAFEAVIRACAEPRPPPGEQESWIDERIVSSYVGLHRAGHAHSVEAWSHGAGGPELVGGLYGVHIGAAFFAESKFHRPGMGTDASKVCLARLVMHLRARGFELLDVQMWNPHLAQFGCVEVARSGYLEQLRAACAKSVSWMPWTANGGHRADR